MRMKVKMKIKTCFYSRGKDSNSFMNEFDHTKNKEDKEKIVKEL